MEDHQIVNCTNKNIVKINDAERDLEDMYEIEGTDIRLLGFINTYLDDLRRQTLRVRYQAEMRMLQQELDSLK